jgi:hypothetical protein
MPERDVLDGGGLVGVGGTREAPRTVEPRPHVCIFATPLLFASRQPRTDGRPSDSVMGEGKVHSVRQRRGVTSAAMGSLTGSTPSWRVPRSPWASQHLTSIVELARRLDVDAVGCLVLEDSAIGYPGLAAGMHFICVSVRGNRPLPLPRRG